MKEWFDYISELQEIAQIGLTYTKDVFDIERFERLREIAVEMMAKLSDQEIETIRVAFASDSGYQTPKVDIRGILLKEDKILLVKERNDKWSLPGGWADIGRSLFENVEKEFLEEASIVVQSESLLAIQNKIPAPHIYPHTIYTHYVLCSEVQQNAFEANHETSDRAYFSIDQLPLMDESKTSADVLRRILAHKNAKVLIIE